MKPLTSEWIEKAEGESADKTAAKEALSLSTAIRAEARKTLRLRR
jgi:hypothetical protein